MLLIWKHYFQFMSQLEMINRTKVYMMHIEIMVKFCDKKMCILYLVSCHQKPNFVYSG